MIDYHLHAKNIASAKTYIEYISKKYKEPNTLSFSQHEDLDLYRSYPLEDYGKRYGVNIVASVSFRSSDGIEFNVINPTNNIDELLNNAISEKSYRLLHILNGLEQLNIYISPKRIIDKMDKTDLLDIHLADNDVILKIMVEDGYCENINIAYNSFLKQVLVPRIFPDTKDLLQKLLGNTVYINNYSKYIQYVETSGNDFIYELGGFIIEKDKNIDKCYLDGSIQILNGSGRIIT